VKQQRGLGVADPLPDYDDGRLHVRPADYIATADGVILRLKPRELGLLAALASQPDRIVTRDELLATVWDPDEKIASRAVDACVARLRATLAPAMPDVRYVHTHARIGYRFGQEPVRTATGSGADAPGTAVSVEVGRAGVGPAETLATSGESDSASNL
jgi:DNA-binding winged helix-turn-helix (wHTH) protein